MESESRKECDRYAKLIAKYNLINLLEALFALCMKDDTGVFKEILQNLTPEIDKEIDKEIEIATERAKEIAAAEQNLSSTTSRTSKKSRENSQNNEPNTTPKKKKKESDVLSHLHTIKNIINSGRPLTEKQIELLQTVFDPKKLQELHLMRAVKELVPLQNTSHGILHITLHYLTLLSNVIRVEITEDNTLARQLLVHHGVIDPEKTKLTATAQPKKSESNPCATERPKKHSDGIILQSKFCILIELLRVVINEEFYTLPKVRNILVHPQVPKDRGTFNELSQYAANNIYEKTTPLEALFGYSHTISPKALEEMMTEITEYKIDIIQQMQRILNPDKSQKELPEEQQKEVYEQFVQKWLPIFEKYNTNWGTIFSDPENRTFTEFIEYTARSLTKKNSDFLSQRLPGDEMPLLQHCLEAMLAPQLLAVKEWQDKMQEIINSIFSDRKQATTNSLKRYKNIENTVNDMPIRQTTKKLLEMMQNQSR
jgi:hypothetical protein